MGTCRNPVCFGLQAVPDQHNVQLWKVIVCRPFKLNAQCQSWHLADLKARRRS